MKFTKLVTCLVVCSTFFSIGAKSQVKIVEANQVFFIESETLLYDSVVMKSGSTIKFSPNLTKTKLSCNVFVAEQGVTIDGKGNKGKDGHHNDTPSGGAGTDGEGGTSGINFTLEVGKFVFCDIKGDFSGGDGGFGGTGTKGRKGSNGSCCTHEGKDGQRGGNGGIGGNGGNAGTFLIKYKTLKALCNQPITEANFRVIGGNGGDGGSAGEGGAGGNKAHGCFPGCNRPGGKKGAKGATGQKGSMGQKGAFSVVQI